MSNEIITLSHIESKVCCFTHKLLHKLVVIEQDLLHCLITEAVDGSVEHPLVCSSTFGDAVLSLVRLPIDTCPGKAANNLDLERLYH